ncbi:MAG: hypothetical protein JWL73_413 [Actinomycetia bacterium]|nr:hypothetical protein [Actinomycetes bacterium]
MCGRFIAVSSPQLLADHFSVEEIRVPEHEACWNVAPRADVLVVVEDRRAEGSPRALEPMRWGLVPGWAKDRSIGDRLINARAETVADKPAYERSFRLRRCLVPADGFYEWRAEREPGAGGRTRAMKQPVFIHDRSGEPLPLAGLWSSWRDPADPDAAWLHSCAIVTTRANELLAPLHDRMPVVLPEDVWDVWLDPAIEDTALLEPLLVPAPETQLELWDVSTRVNKADNDGPDLVEPLPPRTLFDV